ncbi:RING-box protein 1-like [Drosophila kikkawai]|uniref:RING-box protein 1-like n=1 Tax=Drosophila kikkawai TaxID=30033 RepID=A0ABM4GJT3_DROKI
MIICSTSFGHIVKWHVLTFAFQRYKSIKKIKIDIKMSLMKTDEEAYAEAYEEPQEELSEEPSSINENSKTIFKVKRWDAVAMWQWNVEVDNCSICRNQNMELCIECQAFELQGTRQECLLAWGNCNHAFHFHCISRWLKSRRVCPLDNKMWEYQKVGPVSVPKGS